MKTPIKIKYTSLPLRSPLLPSIVLALLLDRLSAPGWLWGAVGTIMAFATIGFLYERFAGVERDVPGFGKLAGRRRPQVSR